jgi:hypothetical protein
MTRHESKSYRYGGRVARALPVIGVGVFFLLCSFGFQFPFPAFHNWWAWFILIAAVSPLSQALRRYRRVGTVDAAVLHSLLCAAPIVMVALMFILELSWALWWPMFVIYGGLCMLGRGRRGEDADRDRSADDRPIRY